MSTDWFKPRGYKHFDAPVGLKFAAKACSPHFVAKHSWLPLIRYAKVTKRYKPKKHITEFKRRPIMYASHRDACILSKYAFELGGLLDTHYTAAGLSDNVIAYRKLGHSNYDFAAEVRSFALSIEPCVVLCFDISGFFDHLDHQILKSLLKRVLGANELSPDWYAVFKNVTQHKWVLRDDLASHPMFADRLNDRGRTPIATIKELTKAGVRIHREPEGNRHFGIPQGTPISSVLANLYMLDFDRALADACAKHAALYRRYSDDILVVAKPEFATALEDVITRSLHDIKLELSVDKTDRVEFKKRSPETFQYLGFNLAAKGSFIRSSSLSKRWRKLKRSIRRTAEAGTAAIKSGKAKKIFTKKLRRKFSPIGLRNFSSYARRAAVALDSEGIRKQVRKLERAADNAIRELNR